MYQSGTWLVLILLTVVCSQDFGAIGWLLAGPKLNTLQDIVIMYQSGTWLQSILLSSQDFWAIG